MTLITVDYYISHYSLSRLNRHFYLRYQARHFVFVFIFCIDCLVQVRISLKKAFFVSLLEVSESFFGSVHRHTMLDIHFIIISLYIGVTIQVR